MALNVHLNLNVVLGSKVVARPFPLNTQQTESERNAHEMCAIFALNPTFSFRYYGFTYNSIIIIVGISGVVSL